jgi:FxsC-like protein
MPPKPASHVFFFSYASENKDAQLEAFFEDLCEEVAPYTRWGARSAQVSFRDGNNLPLMEEWRDGLLRAIQGAAVLVCVTSPAYFQKRFCGQEYYIFDQRRRQEVEPGKPPPAVILPVIWAPTPGGLPDAMDQAQWKDGSMPALYETKGLRYLKRLGSSEYVSCLVAFGQAIKEAWETYPNVVELPNVEPFENIPNPFAGSGTWEEAAGPQGWLPGPGIANFVFAACLGGDLPLPLGRYGEKPSEWRPYLPPWKTTVSEAARSVTKKQSLRYREIPIDQDLPRELETARNRKNLTLVIADPRTLPMSPYHRVTEFDHDPWEGTAVLMPWDDSLGPWEDNKSVVASTFPIRSQAKDPPFQAPIKTLEEFEQSLDVALTGLRAAVTRVEAEKKEKSDDPPTGVQGPSGASP